MNKTELRARATELELDLKALDAAAKGAEATNKDLKAAIAEAEEQIEATEETTEGASYKDDLGRIWIFKPSAPDTINMDGRAVTQEQILEDESLISELVYGKSNYLTQKH